MSGIRNTGQNFSRKLLRIRRWSTAEWTRDFHLHFYLHRTPEAHYKTLDNVLSPISYSILFLYPWNCCLNMTGWWLRPGRDPPLCPRSGRTAGRRGCIQRQCARPPSKIKIILSFLILLTTGCGPFFCKLFYSILSKSVLNLFK